MSSASFLNFAMLLVLMTLSWSQTGKAAPTSDDSDQEAFRPAVSIEENACDSSIKMVEVGSSDQYGCYPGKNGSNATMPQCWRTCNFGEDGCTWSKWWDFKWNNYHGWCNIAKEKCTKSLHKSAGCPMKHKHTWDYGGHTCPKGPLDPRANGPTGQRTKGPKRLYWPIWTMADVPMWLSHREKIRLWLAFLLAFLRSKWRSMLGRGMVLYRYRGLLKTSGLLESDDRELYRMKFKRRCAEPPQQLISVKDSNLHMPTFNRNDFIIISLIRPLFY